MCKYIYSEIIRNNEKLISIMSHFQIHYHFKLDFFKLDQHTGGQLLIHSTKRYEDNQLQAWNPL